VHGKATESLYQLRYKSCIKQDEMRKWAVAVNKSLWTGMAESMFHHSAEETNVAAHFCGLSRMQKQTSAIT